MSSTQIKVQIYRMATLASFFQYTYYGNVTQVIRIIDIKYSLH